jgi:hypothetical protein
MTTIAWDGATLAADSWESRRAPTRGKCSNCEQEVGRLKSTITKIQLPKHPVLFNGSPLLALAGAGNGSLIDLYAVGINEGIGADVLGRMACKVFEERPTKPSMSLVVITDATAWEIMWDQRVGTMLKEITQIPYSVGSGSKAAMLAMKRLGLTAMAAVACGIDVDPSSGGEVCYVHCRGEEKADALLRYTYTEADVLELFQ